LLGWKVDESCSGLCPVVNFGISGIDPFGSVISVLENFVKVVLIVFTSYVFWILSFWFIAASKIWNELRLWYDGMWMFGRALQFLTDF